MDDLTVLKDIKKEVEFWIEALSNENLSDENKKLLNECLQYELNSYLLPFVVIGAKTNNT